MQVMNVPSTEFPRYKLFIRILHVYQTVHVQFVSGELKPKQLPPGRPPSFVITQYIQKMAFASHHINIFCSHLWSGGLFSKRELGVSLLKFSGATYCSNENNNSSEKLDVSGFEEPAFQTEMIDQLVINPERRKTLKALASNYIRKNHAGESSDMEMWSADFIAGKGQGIIFLLHGRPGVGKTYTAGMYK